MQNNNSEPTSNVPIAGGGQAPVVPAAPPSAIEQDIAQLKSLAQKIKAGIAEKKLATQQPGAKTGGPVNRKLLYIIGGVFVVSLLLLVVATLAKPRSGSRQNESPTPTPTVGQIGPTTEVTNPSRYATDAAVIKLGEDIKSLDQEMVNTQIKEVDLVPPTLDWEINFK